MSLFDLSGKTAIVTGGNGGIGLGMALGLAEAGASVAVVGRDAEKTRRAAAEIEEKTRSKALAVVADLCKPEDVERAVAEAGAHFGRIDALFNNAGINIRRAPQEFTLNEWRQVMDANVTSAFLASQAAYPWMKRQGGGKIINTGSMTSVLGS